MGSYREFVCVSECICTGMWVSLHPPPIENSASVAALAQLYQQRSAEISDFSDLCL